ncbi:pilus assembly protein [Thalassotalea sp. ND16A]|uniref:pilus assembly protein n=1 Tax=Thalassotalea sp. ND16A TaxID=1535422 RepID=UPI00051CF941|nr:PilC/PilY family type IV pilus protein [Thalassotalea sp. ND16A]KGJ88146.1 hypothetical protein ND16A_2699 [Thalassotalea sp. ND16A]
MSISIKESGIFLASLLICNLVSAAAPFTANQQPVGYLQPMALSTTNLENGAYGYRPWFENGAWQGDLVQYTISSGGASTTSVDLSTTTPTNSGNNWSARLKFNAAEAADSSYWTSSRKIITHNGVKQVAFRWDNLSATQQEQLDQVSYLNSASSSPILDFVRGDRSNEKPNGSLRPRYNLLGDIIHSNPVYVSAPTGNNMSSDYITFKAKHASRAPRVYVGANDGMLHVFDAVTGKEVYAFIPPEVIPRLDNLSDEPYYHQYYVDGELSVHDAYFNGAWHTVLIGSLGAGGTSRFALDITNPQLTNEDSLVATDNKVLWVQNSSSNSALGDAYGNASIAKLPDKKYYVISGNGYNSAAGKAELVLTELSTGTISKISTGSAAGNGLSTPALIDLNRDGLYDFAYAGDLNGNLWKFDLTSKSVAYSKPLYAAGVSQPITTKPIVSSHPTGGKLVYFATGKTLAFSDLADTSPQGVYGIWDTGKTPGTANLLNQTLSAPKAIGTETVLTSSNIAIDWSKHTGWKVALTAGKRIVANYQLRDRRLQMTVTNPVDEENWLFEPNYLTGGAPKTAIFDIDGNGMLEPTDNVGGGEDGTDIAVAWQIPQGITSGPLIARVKEGVDTKFINFTQLTEPPPAEPPGCKSGCNFVGGHIDVDTDGPKPEGNGHAGMRTAHTHQYDKKVKQPYVDLFQLNTAKNAQIQVDEAITDNKKKFFVLVSNADFSPAGQLHIGLNTYNVVAYQQMIQRKLETWDGQLTTLTDDDGNSLIVSIDDIKAGGGTLRVAFTDQALISGGIHPDDTKCSEFPYERAEQKNRAFSMEMNGRWRGGPLTLMMMDPSKVKSLADLHIQTPPDLKASVRLPGETIYLTDDINGDGVIDNDIDGDGQLDIYGGLRAKGEVEGDAPANGMLLEFWVYWHYSKDENGKRLYDICYGEPGYELAVADVRGFMTEDSFERELVNLGYNDFASLTAALNAIITTCGSSSNSCFNNATDANGNKASDLATMEDYSTKLAVNPFSGESNGGGGDGTVMGSASTEPVVVMSGNIPTGVISGPSFTKGRRTWVDISSQ